MHSDINGGKHVTYGCACKDISSKTGDGEHLHLCGSVNVKQAWRLHQGLLLTAAGDSARRVMCGQRWPNISTQAGIHLETTLALLRFLANDRGAGYSFVLAGLQELHVPC